MKEYDFYKFTKKSEGYNSIKQRSSYVYNINTHHPFLLLFLNDKQIEFAGKCTGTINKMQYTRRGKLSAHT